MREKSKKKLRSTDLTRSLTTKILLFIGIPVSIGFLLTAFLVLNSVYQSVGILNKDQLKTSTISASHQVDEELTQYISQAETLGKSAALAEMLIETTAGKSMQDHPHYEATLATIRRMKEDNSEVLTFFVADEDGKQALLADGTLLGDFDITTRPWYQGVKTRNGIFITEPYEDVTTGMQVITVTAPVYKTGTSTIIGAIGIDITLNKVYEIFENYTIGETGYYLLLSSTGHVIYHPDQSKINKPVNEIGLSDNIVTALSSHTLGNIEFKSGSETNQGYISKLDKIDWLIAGALPAQEFNQYSYKIRSQMTIMTLISILIVLAVIVLISRSIVSPLRRLRDAAHEIANGNLDVAINVKSSDETGEVAEAMKQTTNQLANYIAYIQEITDVLTTMAKGDFRITLNQEYSGNFAPIKKALLEIIESLNHTMSLITTTAQQVNQGAYHVSSTSQSLASGATEQASTIEELTASISEIANDINANVTDMREASQHVSETASSVQQSTAYMDQLQEAMADIEAKSRQISSITKLIEDIAFQTNILALNAAIEAARAGQYGKGFAVVADEVRALAAKSSEAASQTSELIRQSVEAVSTGNALTQQTAEILHDISKKSQKLHDIIRRLNDSANQQANAFHEITSGLEQVSNVVQANAASAEEGSAASEELSAQATLLDEEVKKFKLRNS